MNKDEVLNGWMNWVRNVKPREVLQGLADMWRQIETSGPLKKLVRKIRLSWNMVQDSLSGRYRGLSKGDLALIVAALAYLVLAVDIVPDFIPVVGLLDDCAVLSWVFTRFAEELKRYEAFVEVHGEVVEAEIVADGTGEFDNLSHGE